MEPLWLLSVGTGQWVLVNCVCHLLRNKFEKGLFGGKSLFYI